MFVLVVWLAWASACLCPSHAASPMLRAYFPSGFPDIDFQTVVDYGLPMCKDLSKLDTALSYADLQKIPLRVAHWTNFTQKVRDYRTSFREVLLRKVISTQNFSFFDSVAYDKKDLSTYFVLGAGSRLDNLFGNAVITRRKASPAVDIGEGLRQPDFLIERVAGMNLFVHCHISSAADGQDKELQDSFLQISENFTYPANVALAVGEMKRHNFHLRGKDETSRGEDLVKRYNAGDRQVIDAIYQITAYQILYGCKFGFITTYGKTWATCMSHKGVLYISPAYSSYRKGHDSLLNMMHFVLSLSANQLGSGNHVFDLPTDLSSPDMSYGPGSLNNKEARARDQRLLKVRMDKISSRGVLKLKCCRHLVSHQNRVTYQARVLDSNNSFVAVKCYEAAEDRNKEVACYNALRCLQGDCIPKLLVANCSVPWDESRTHGLVLSWVGKQFGGNYMSLPKRALLQAHAIMLRMHKRGVVHRDLRPENMNYDFETGKLYIYDFSEARTLKILGFSRFHKARREDCEMMQELVESAEAFEESGGRFRGDLPLRKPALKRSAKKITSTEDPDTLQPPCEGQASATPDRKRSIAADSRAGP